MWSWPHPLRRRSLQVSRGDSTVTYDYDDLGRLTEACFAPGCAGAAPDGGDAFARYTYDPVGNRLTEVRPAGTTASTYNAADQLTQTQGPAGTVVYAYDPNGNQTREGARTFSYDLANRLTRITDPLAGDLGKTLTYSYDGDGVRTQATVTQLLVTTTTKYLWDRQGPLPELAIERDGAGKLLRRYVHGHGVVSETVPDLLPPITPEEETFPYHADGTGSTLALTDSDGNVQWRYTFDPYGGARKEEKADLLAPENRMRFTGQMLDSETGLYHLRARQYAPGTGRFLQTDPKGRGTGEPSVGAYVYADDRPTVLVDPSGERGVQPISWCQYMPVPVVPIVAGTFGGTSQCAPQGPDFDLQDDIAKEKEKEQQKSFTQRLIDKLRCDSSFWEFLLCVLAVGTTLDPGDSLWRAGPLESWVFTPRPRTDPEGYPWNGVSTWTTRIAACEAAPSAKLAHRLDVDGLLDAPDLLIVGDWLKVGHYFLAAASRELHEQWAASRPATLPPTRAEPHSLTKAVMRTITDTESCG